MESILRHPIRRDRSHFIHSFIGFRRPTPHLRPFVGSHLITDHHSHLACVPFQLCAQFLSDDPREKHAHWPRLESSNRSLIQTLPFLHGWRPLPVQSDPLPIYGDPTWYTWKNPRSRVAWHAVNIIAQKDAWWCDTSHVPGLFSV